MFSRYLARYLVACCFFAHVAFSSMAFAADAYLDELASEAEDSAHVPSGDQKDGMSEGKRLAKLEAFLLKEKPTTFKYYEKLKSGDKTKVLKVYESSSSSKQETLAVIRKKVLDLYFKR